ncbi:probable 2-oxoglutarate-dependent dioxygenase At3g111800 [Selaginella moellendorffii]|uniref:probable 2-oxoglutarate-dependent dioxygenase At3g111800 n=1 Tax=Selaginella moellendorffii TaxID=88036 RepID=UPI000D1C5B23|nr:probable 2-oxoglutarate-dependent dioxygenase At3g111800 [Selaginella moellendorffii]|eukprot:XP_024519387.1 probable 2-oxoglutarate-dependent dioxygenase At3g111800 [Selaginella moellendorffii]
MRVNYYPPCPQPDEVLGLSSHSDATIITVVIEDADVLACISARMVKLLRTFSSNRALAMESTRVLITEVIVNTKKDRLYVVLFHGPEFPAIMSPTKQLLGEDRPPLYRDISFADYMKFSHLQG